MTPPRPSDTGTPQTPEPPAAVLSFVPEGDLPTVGPATAIDAPALPTAGTALPTTIRLRSDYLLAAQGRKAGTGGLLLQGRARGDDLAPRFGFTASKKIGNAVFRNRAKRRMRALAHEILRPLARMGWDYVLVAKPGATVIRDWTLLQADLRDAVARVHK